MRKKKQKATDNLKNNKSSKNKLLDENQLKDLQLDCEIEPEDIEEDFRFFLENEESVYDYENEEGCKISNDDACNKGEFVVGESALTSYFKTLGDCSVVSKERELEMFKALRDGDESMVEAIFRANAKLVPFVVKRLFGAIANNPSMDFDDLISAGNVGLLKAIELFDINRGCKFSTYAYNWIYVFAERAVCNDANLIRVPVHIQDKIRKIKKIEKKIELQKKRELTSEEKLKIVEDVVGSERGAFMIEQYNKYTSPISLSTVISEEDDDSELGDLIASKEPITDDMVLSNSLKQDVLSAMEDCLPKKNIEILKLRFGFDTGTGMTLEEVGKVYGITRERVRQIEGRSIQLLRRSRRFRHLKDYMNPN